MDISRLSRCIENCERLHRMLDENKSEITACTGDGVVQIYVQAMDEIEAYVSKTMRDLTILYDANCI